LNGRRRWPLHVRCCRKKFTFAISSPDEFLFSVANDLDKTQTGSPVTANGGAKCRWSRLNAGAVAEN